MKNKRKYPRKFCSESSFFATRYGIHECYIKNLGNKGAFIETDLFLPEGNVVTSCEKRGLGAKFSRIFSFIFHLLGDRFR